MLNQAEWNSSTYHISYRVENDKNKLPDLIKCK